MIYYLEREAERRARYGDKAKRSKAKQTEGRKEDLLCRIGLC